MALIKVSRGNDLLYETWANGEDSITSLASAIRTVQKESNEFLSKLVEKEKSSNNNTESKTGDGNSDDQEENEDSEDDADNKGDEIKSVINVEVGKRRNTSKSSPNSKKLCSDK